MHSGRSAQALRWEQTPFPGVSFDLEPQFGKAPGVLYLTAEVCFDEPGDFRLVLASPVGHILWIDGRRAAWYQDSHIPVPRPLERYTTEFTSSGWTGFLVKSIRHDAPVGPTYLYFLDQAGKLCIPAEFRFPETHPGEE